MIDAIYLTLADPSRSVEQYSKLIRVILGRFRLCVATEAEETRGGPDTACSEAAGSHGVWGMDDFVFLPFLFGAAELDTGAAESDSPCSDITDLARVGGHAARGGSLFFDALQHILDTKTGPLHEHSPSLHGISGVAAGWPKIAKGMVKMVRVRLERVSECPN